MAVSKDPTGLEMALFGVQQVWPKWKQVTLVGNFTRNFTDSTYDGLGGSNLAGGDTTASFGGTRVFSRWQEEVPYGLSADVALAYGNGFSYGFGSGKLYTHRGAVDHPTSVDEVGGSLEQVYLGCSWEINPLLTTPPPGSTGLRGPSDGVQMRMKGSVSNLHFGWGAETFSDGTTEWSIETVSTAFDDVLFDLGNLAAGTFSFSKTRSYEYTYHPSAPDSAGPPAYYPTRGSTLMVSTATLTVLFAA